MTLAVAILMKDPGQAKSRLGPVLPSALREALALRMFRNTVETLLGWQISGNVAVITPSTQIATSAADLGAEAVLEADRTGLNAAAELALTWAEVNDAKSVLLLHSDIPVLDRDEIDQMLEVGGQGRLVVGQSKDGGTNALLLPSSARLQFCYGPNSAKAHALAAKVAGLQPIRLLLPHLSHDLDTPADLAVHFPRFAAVGDQEMFSHKPKELCR